MPTDEAAGERTAIWLQERPAGYDQLQWVHDAELLSPFTFLLKQETVTDYIDLGTGTGAALKSLAPLALNATGVDISAKMLDQVRPDEAGNIRLIQADAAQAIPLRAESADLVTERMMLHDLVDPGRAIAEAWRLVKPGGQLIISENVIDIPNEEVVGALQGFLAGGRDHSPLGNEDFFHVPSTKSVAFLRGLFALKHEPDRHLWSGQELKQLLAEACPGATDPQLVFSIKYWDTGNWLEKSGFPIEECKQAGIINWLGADPDIKDEWGLDITLAGESMPRETHQDLLTIYRSADSMTREDMDVNAFFYAAFSNISVTKQP